jgi:hypothetical protein
MRNAGLRQTSRQGVWLASHVQRTFSLWCDIATVWTVMGVFIAQATAFIG